MTRQPVIHPAFWKHQAVLLGTCLAVLGMGGCAPASVRAPIPPPATERSTDTEAAPPTMETVAMGSSTARSPAEITTQEEEPSPMPTQTPIPEPVSPYPEGCVEALSITNTDAGRTLCVAGIVHAANLVRGDYYISFSSDQTVFYMVSYGWGDGDSLVPGDCVYATGEVERLGSTPLMSVTRFMLKSCSPLSATPTPPPPPGLPEDCRYALTITLADYGNELCVGGAVSHVAVAEDVYEIYFYSNQQVGLRFIIYNLKPGERGVNPGECIYVRDRRVDRVGQRLVMVVLPREIRRCSPG